jgi:hypothetical protein
MDAIPEGERAAHAALASGLFAKLVRERRDVPGGYAFRFEADRLADLARFVANERRCCPFLSFRIELAPDEGPVWLRITGPPGTRQLLAQELPGFSAITRPATSVSTRSS